MRNGVCVLLVALAAAAVALPAGADTTTVAATTTAETTTTAPTTDATTTGGTTTATTTAGTTTDETATTATTAASTTDTTDTTAVTTGTTAVTTGAGTATTTAALPAAPIEAFVRTEASAVPKRCASAGAAAILAPGRPPLALGAAPARLGASVYPGSRYVVRFGRLDALGAACRPGSISIRELSLFGGAVTVTRVVARNGRGRTSGVRIGDRLVKLLPGKRLRVGRWGVLTTGAHLDARFGAPLALRLVRPRGGLPAGTVVLVGFAAKPAAARAKKRRRNVHRPLEVTPPLGLPHYDFPVAGGASYGDSYGGARSDISDGWHHGDDLFAPLGTPVVAVASGRLSLVGWEKLGGWRLWLRDANGNRFYYAHLAAYSRWILKHPNVKAGQVIGFLGRTGDAFTTPPHLHFEIHPRSLRRLGYDGAVDPTSYLRGWTTVRAASPPPRPALPLRRPKGEPGREAAVVWRQLLATPAGRILPPSPPKHVRVPLARRPLAAFPAFLPSGAGVAAALPHRPRTGPLPAFVWPLLAFAGAAALVTGGSAGASRLVRRRRA